MKLFQHKDFEQAILGAEQHFHARKLRPATIEKDYYVTEALRIIAAAAPDKIIFKGGTSLAKGWNLIQRFSEDIDIFLDPLAFKPTLGKNAIDRQLKNLRDAVAAHPALTFVARRRARPSADSGATTASPTHNASAAPAKSPTASSLKPERRAAASPPASSSCAPIWDSSSRKRARHWARTTRDAFPCACCISGGPSSKKCSPSTAKWNCSSATRRRSEPMRGTITTCFNWRRRRKSSPC